MIFLIHKDSQLLVKVRKDDTSIHVEGQTCTDIFWELALRFPEELLVWCEVGLEDMILAQNILNTFHHDLMMSSYAVKTRYLSEGIEYVDQLPFINVKQGVKYPTWTMSSDIGVIKGKTLLKFKPLLKGIQSFPYLLNSVAKVGQQNGLFCYSDPGLIDSDEQGNFLRTTGRNKLFLFVYQHYKTIWIFVLFFCYVKYEKSLPVFSFLKCFLKPKFFKKDVDISEIKIVRKSLINNPKSSIDVIIPTIGRPEYVKQVVEDFSKQSHLPTRLIIVEQQPDLNLNSDIQNFLAKEWPFQIIHIFTHNTGACMARNRALEKVESEWIFFADDDIRIGKQVLAKTLEEAERLTADCISLNCRQPGEETFFCKVKQWGSFGSGTSLVRSQFAKHLHFSEVFEHGYGEDVDFGMKLREKGCDIIYHPKLEIQHLKAPVGGFRKKSKMEWEKENLRPKPSPTLMILVKKYYTQRQIKGFKISLFLRFYQQSGVINPFSYFKQMNRRWKISESWAKKLLAQTKSI